MKTTRIIFALALSLNSVVFCSYLALSQSREEIIRMKNIIAAEQHKSGYSYAHDNNNEVHWFFSGLFLFYKKFISSQDGSSCTFSPSCSEYGYLTVKKHGLFKGIPDIFDRLSRCNGLSPENYEIDRETGLFIDSAEQ